MKEKLEDLKNVAISLGNLTKELVSIIAEPLKEFCDILATLFGYVNRRLAPVKIKNLEIKHEIALFEETLEHKRKQYKELLDDSEPLLKEELYISRTIR